MLESYAFTEDKRKEVRENIEERVRLLEDEHVSCSSTRLVQTSRKTRKMQYEHILKDASLSDAIRTLETKDPAVSACPSPAHRSTHLLQRQTDAALASPRDRTRRPRQIPRQILPLALHPGRDLIPPSLPALLVAPRRTRPSRCTPATRPGL